MLMLLETKISQEKWGMNVKFLKVKWKHCSSILNEKKQVETQIFKKFFFSPASPTEEV